MLEEAIAEAKKLLGPDLTSFLVFLPVNTVSLSKSTRSKVKVARFFVRTSFSEEKALIKVIVYSNKHHIYHPNTTNWQVTLHQSLSQRPGYYVVWENTMTPEARKDERVCEWPSLIIPLSDNESERTESGVSKELLLTPKDLQNIFTNRTQLNGKRNNARPLKEISQSISITVKDGRLIINCHNPFFNPSFLVNIPRQVEYLGSDLLPSRLSGLRPELRELVQPLCLPEFFDLVDSPPPTIRESPQKVQKVRVSLSHPPGSHYSDKNCPANCVFCHLDYFQPDNKIVADPKEMGRAIRLLDQAITKMIELKVTGFGDPLVLPTGTMEMYLHNLRSPKVVGINVITNGIYTEKDFRVSNLFPPMVNRVTFSLPASDIKGYSKVTRTDALHNVLRGIEALQLENLRMKPKDRVLITLNAPFSIETANERSIMRYLLISIVYGATIKFFDILPPHSPSHVPIDKLYRILHKLSLKCSLETGAEVQPFFVRNEEFPESEMIIPIKINNRTHNARVEIKESKKNNCPNLSCQKRNECYEGCRESIRVSQTRVLQPCGVRQDNMLDLSLLEGLDNRFAIELIRIVLKTGGKFEGEIDWDLITRLLPNILKSRGGVRLIDEGIIQKFVQPQLTDNVLIGQIKEIAASRDGVHKGKIVEKNNRKISHSFPGIKRKFHLINSKETDETLVVVDKYDCVVGMRPKSQLQPNFRDMRTVNVFFVNPEGKLWIPTRTNHVPIFPSCLDMGVGLYLRFEEEYYDGYIRGVFEETLCDPKKFPCIKLGKLSPYKDGVSTFMTVYTIITKDAPPLNPRKYCGAKWMAPLDLLRIIQSGEPAKPDLPILVSRFFLRNEYLN